MSNIQSVGFSFFKLMSSPNLWIQVGNQEFKSDTIYLELASYPMNLGLNPVRLSPFRCYTQVLLFTLLLAILL
jgi:hypothetical protein